MKRIGITLTLLFAVIGCDRIPSQTTEPGDLISISDAAPSHAELHGKPEIDPTYANGETVFMIGPHTIANASVLMPNAYAQAEELYLIVFPQETVPAPGALPITLPSGYQPQCNPCFHPGVPALFAFHDHVIPGAPGMGKNGTADGMKAPWKIILLMYNPAYVASGTFTPIKSEAAIDAAEDAGNVFLPVNPGGENPYEIDTGTLLICPIVSSHA
jgi:hypothetical protein